MDSPIIRATHSHTYTLFTEEKALFKMPAMLNIQQQLCQEDRKTRSKMQNTNKPTTTKSKDSSSGSCCYWKESCVSNKRGEARGRCLSGTAHAAGGPVEGAVLAGGFRWQQGGCGSPASLWPEQSALTLALGLGLWGRGTLWEQRGQRRHRWGVLPWLLFHQGLGLGVAVCRRTRDALLLPSPGVVIRGVTDVVVDEGVGLLPALIHLVFAVAALWGKTKVSLVK